MRRVTLRRWNQLLKARRGRVLVIILIQSSVQRSPSNDGGGFGAVALAWDML